ncbi:MAG: PAS domain S-box protein, partial [Chloroflexales bacterium]|nr:PAS domain S-box protein [Chloroflexales bacterium]
MRDQLITLLRREGRITSRELAFRHASGALGTALVAAELVTVGAEPYMLALLNDITAQKQAEAALRASEARFRTVVTHAQPIIFMLDRAGTFLLSEGKMLSALGLAPGQVVGQSAFTRYQDYPAILHGLRTALGGVHYEDTIDVGGVIFDIFYTPYRDSAGAVSGLIGMAVDITERRRAEAALRERESQLRLANEAGDIGTWRHDLATNRIRFDARGRSHYGFECDETTLEAVLARIHPDDLGRLQEEIAATISPAGDGAYRTEYRVIHPDGAIHWLAVQTRVYFAGEGDARRPVLGFGTSQDITARTQASAALRESETRYRAMFEQNAAMQLLLDSRSGAIIDANPAAVRFYGYPRATLLTMEIGALNLLAPAQVRAELDAARGGRRNQFHFQHRLASGEVRAVEVFSCLIEVGGTQLIYAIVHDETERVRAEQALQAERASLAQHVTERTAELAAALRAKDEFLANMSHELRTPLNAILGRAELLREGIHGPLNAQQDQDLAAIDEAGLHLLSLINDVLDLARIEAGRLTLERAPLQVADLCQAALRMVAQAAVQQQQRLHTTIDPQVAMLDADARRLKQILVNLLANAVKFTPPGGEVGLEVCGNPDEQTVTFTVWDTGIGIAPEDQARLFQPFEQGSSGLSRQYGGTGLGLAVVLRLVELHGGSVALESSPGAGSRFRVTLPWVPPAQLSPLDTQIVQAATASVHVGTGSETMSTQPLILLADDSAANVAVLRDYLRSVGYRVVVAHDGMEAVTRALELRPALILMDIQMPVLDGLAAIGQIRAAGMTTTPIIALTALAMPGDR